MSSIILAGGRSSRLGQDKSSLVIGGVNLLQKTVDLLGQMSDDIIVVLAPEQKKPGLRSSKKVKLVKDLHEGKGPLIGIYSAMKGSSDEYYTVVACDMPFLNIDLLRYMRGIAMGFDAVTLRVAGEVEPLHAVYSRSCLNIMEQLINENQLKIRNLFEQIAVRYVDEDEIDSFDPEHLSWFNINTPEDLERAEEILRQHAES
ncbi:MAG: molybdenum cofactor guanylyltransferase [Dehalococcoidia bacterium]